LGGSTQKKFKFDNLLTLITNSYDVLVKTVWLPTFFKISFVCVLQVKMSYKVWFGTTWGWLSL